MNMYSSLQVSTSMFREFFVVKDERRKRHNKTNSVYKKNKKNKNSIKQDKIPLKLLI